MTKPELFSPDLEMKNGKPWLEFQIKDYSPKEAGSLKIKEDESYYYTYYYLHYIPYYKRQHTYS